MPLMSENGTKVEVGKLNRSYLNQKIGIRGGDSYLEARIVDIQFLHPRSIRLATEWPGLMEDGRVNQAGAVILAVSVLGLVSEFGFPIDEEVEVISG